VKTNTSQLRKLGLITTSAFVIANMVGTGVFTSLGYQISGIENVIAILVLWVVGGIIALCGSLVYSELGAAMPRSGGEYHYLTKIYHPLLGFLSGWVSLTVGFAAPVALAAMALGKYASNLLPFLSPTEIEHAKTIIALVVITLISLIHAYDIKFGGNFQNVFTGFKLALIIIFILCGFLITPHLQNLSGVFHSLSFKDFLNPNIAVSLVFVSYAFSGWNASAYIASEIENPQKTIPRSLFLSTLIVTVLYFMLNLTFLLTAPTGEMAGKEDVGYVSAFHIFGATGGNIMALLISILLVSTISSMIFVGPRVSQVMGEDYTLLKFLSLKSKRGTPYYAILVQFLISFLLIVTSTFKNVMTYAGFTLMLFTFITVLGVFVHRRKFKNIERPYKTWGYPFVPILYLVVVLWICAYTVKQSPIESILGFITVLSGSVIYYANYFIKKNDLSKSN
jgi:APA family basic amino acid/polyamine antiporter